MAVSNVIILNRFWQPWSTWIVDWSRIRLPSLTLNEEGICLVESEGAVAFAIVSALLLLGMPFMCIFCCPSHPSFFQCITWNGLWWNDYCENLCQLSTFLQHWICNLILVDFIFVHAILSRVQGLPINCTARGTRKLRTAIAKEINTVIK